tara:strand:+ start:125 stop:334 length:210 start_codon:yes stop_codon:yes gene_type:complete
MELIMTLFQTIIDDERMIPILLDHDWMIKETSYCKLVSCNAEVYKQLKKKYLNKNSKYYETFKNYKKGN